MIARYFHYSAAWASIAALDVKKPPQEAPQRPSMMEVLANPSAGLAWASTASAVAKSNGGDPLFVVKGVK